MAVYYRFCGFVACLALAANLLFVFAVMILLNAPLTLPGVAGLALTVGMAVDSNVLIFERLREEMARGTGLRMAIRNGFDRATTPIVDSNLTTVITGRGAVRDRHRSASRIRGHVDLGYLDEHVHRRLLLTRRVRYCRASRLDQGTAHDAVHWRDEA